MVLELLCGRWHQEFLQGIRPKIIEGTMPDYVELIKDVGIMILKKDQLLVN
jgi:hypothetical protein